jgi:hypothetical protein
LNVAVKADIDCCTRRRSEPREKLRGHASEIPQQPQFALAARCEQQCGSRPTHNKHYCRLAPGGALEERGLCVMNYV